MHCHYQASHWDETLSTQLGLPHFDIHSCATNDHAQMCIMCYSNRPLNRRWCKKLMTQVQLHVHARKWTDKAMLLEGVIGAKTAQPLADLRKLYVTSCSAYKAAAEESTSTRLWR